MLFSQISISLQKDKIDFYKISSDKYSKLNEIIYKLNDERMIGSLDDSLPYIGMKLRMKWGYLGWEHNSPISFWGYAFKDQIFALAGSKHHLLGQPANGHAHSHSLTNEIVNWLLDKFGYPVEKGSRSLFDYQNLSEYDVANGIYLAVTQMTGQESDFEFVAKVLHRSYWNEGFRDSGFKQIILATPLYMSLEE